MLFRLPKSWDPFELFLKLSFFVSDSNLFRLFSKSLIESFYFELIAQLLLSWSAIFASFCIRISVMSSTFWRFLNLSEERSLFNSTLSLPPMSLLFLSCDLSMELSCFSIFCRSSNLDSIFCVLEKLMVSAFCLKSGLSVSIFSCSSSSYLTCYNTFLSVYSPMPRLYSILSLFSCIISKGLKSIFSIDIFFSIFILSIKKLYTWDLLIVFGFWFWLRNDFEYKSLLVIYLGDSNI